MRGRRAVVLISGGLDSAVAATLAKCERFDLYALTFDYGQRNAAREIEAAKQIADALRVKEHKVIKIPLDLWGGSALTDKKIDVPKNRTRAEIGKGIPTTYVPGRNTIFLAFALSYAEAVQANSIFIGAHAVDYSGYPDCRPEYFEKFDELARLATKTGVEGEPINVAAPLVAWDKAKIIETGLDLKAPLKFTWSCYEDGSTPCGTCDACQIRRDAFARVGVSDPAAPSKAHAA